VPVLEDEVLDNVSGDAIDSSIAMGKPQGGGWADEQLEPRPSRYSAMAVLPGGVGG